MSDSLSSFNLESIQFSPKYILQAICNLKLSKSDGSGLSSDHLVNAAPVISSTLADLCTAIIRHGHMPEALSNCNLVLIPKGQKDPTKSDNYRPIALAPTLSKVIEQAIILQYSEFFFTSDLQFGFKKGFSTSLCTGLLKNTVSRYIHCGSTVFGCFLDASKAFDLVNHDILFQHLLDRKLPLSLTRMLLSWYRSQRMQVQWGQALSGKFPVSNGVRQGGVLSPIHFTIYIDDLLLSLQNPGVGFFWQSYFTGAVCYADDLALLAPSASALRLIIHECKALQFHVVLDLIQLKPN